MIIPDETEADVFVSGDKIMLRLHSLRTGEVREREIVNSFGNLRFVGEEKKYQRMGL